jgi:hypothetical protein
MARAVARPHSTMAQGLTHPVTKSPTSPIIGKKTRTDKAPMSTKEYSGHIGSYERHLKGSKGRK